LKADAKVVQRHIARFSDNPDCKRELQEIEDDFLRADTIFEEKQWALAAECYARIVERGKALEEAVARRAAEEKARREAEEKARREAVESERLVALPKTGTVKSITLPGGVTMEMIYCAPGEFMMGSDNGDADEKPRHKVKLTKGFWLGKFQVTQKQWRNVMGNNPASAKGDDLPVEMVSWNDCHDFIDKVNAQLNCEARLPTEAEWEYACRAGSGGDFGGTGKVDDMGWYNNTVFGFGLKLHPVGQKNPNAWGFFDMHGNVWEWCNDCYDGDYYKKCPVEDPMGPPSLGDRVVRGGSWINSEWGCRSSNRFRYDTGSRFDCCGFRLCCSAE
jgi:formylglycine-generating enzyme required for sulfatase activity